MPGNSDDRQTEKLTPAQVLALAAATPLFNADTMCAAMHMSRPTLTRMARSGQLEAMGIRTLKIGCNWRFPSADVLKVLGLELPAPRARRAAARKPRATTAA